MKRHSTLAWTRRRIYARAVLINSAAIVAIAATCRPSAADDTAIGWNVNGQDNNWANAGNWLVNNMPATVYPNNGNGVSYAVTISSGGNAQVSVPITIDTLNLISNNGGAVAAVTTGGSLGIATLSMAGEALAQLTISGSGSLKVGTGSIDNSTGGAADVLQSGGTATFGSPIIDMEVGSHGKYDLQGGQLTAQAREQLHNGATFNQSGSSTNSLSQELFLGSGGTGPVGAATYNLSAGTLAVPSYESSAKVQVATAFSTRPAA